MGVEALVCGEYRVGVEVHEWGVDDGDMAVIGQ